MIYLDNAATTKMFEGCVDIIKDYACNLFYNPSAGYKQAIENSKLIDGVRRNILNVLGAQKGEIIFTSGATESNNLAIRGSQRNGKWEYIFSMGEHPSVYNTALDMQAQGAIVHFVPLQKNGEIDYDKLESLLNDKTRLISCMHVSNETGVVNDLSKIIQLKKQYAKNALLHVDGVQAFCKIPLQNGVINDIDFYSFSAHKFHGPKGVGGLYVKNIEPLKAIVFGGGQEQGKRSGTENLPAIMAMDYAIKQIDINANYDKVVQLRNRFLNVFKREDGVGFIESQSPYIISMSFCDVNGETLMRAVENDVIIGVGSACSAKHSGNRILENLGFTKDKVKSSVRISFNAYMDLQDVEMAGKIILKKYKEIREKVR